MVNYSWHLQVARQICYECDIIDKTAFMFGSILPDVPWMDYDDIRRNSEKIRTHCLTMLDSRLFTVPDINFWLNKYERLVKDSDLYKGYLSHLLLDEEVAQTWNLVHIRSEYDMNEICIGNYRSVLTDKELYVMCDNDVNSYTAKVFDESLISVPIYDWISDKEKEYLAITMKLGESELNTMLHNVDSCIKSMTNRAIEVDIMPTRQYDLIHLECKERCKRMIML